MWSLSCHLFLVHSFLIRGVLKKEYKVLLLAHINCEVKVIFKKVLFII